MTASDSFVEFLRDQLRCVGPIAVRRMFGGAGVYADGIMFALVADDTLYFKSDAQPRADFEPEGLAAFSYATKDGRNTIMSYWRAPESLYDDPDEMRVWPMKALGAARRADAAKPKGTRRKRSPER